eukprot:COSAG02_NODE_3102_length_7368_cov_92.599120_4_plen_62_part_00
MDGRLAKCLFSGVCLGCKGLPGVGCKGWLVRDRCPALATVRCSFTNHPLSTHTVPVYPLYR